MLISFEGIDGCGKSTQARLLAESLTTDGVPVVLTREPGGSPGAEQIRGLLVEGAGERWSPETECLLFTAARRDHLERTIRPALEAGSTVISDRFVDSTRVYQGATRGDLRALVDQMHALMIGIEADRTFVIDMEPEIALQRGLARGSGEDRFESLGLEFHHKIARGFRALSAEFSNRVRLIDGTGDVEAVAARVRAAL